MSVKLHYPPELAVIDEDDPVIFLAGPIQGARDWQADACTYLTTAASTRKSTLHIANPRRNYIDASFDYGQQVSWEKTMLRRASVCGAILVWLAAQDPNEPHEEGRLYAQTTRFEFGRVMGWLDYNPNVNLIIGIEHGYKGSEKYYKTCAKEEDKNFSVYQSLADVCKAAFDATAEH